MGLLEIKLLYKVTTLKAVKSEGTPLTQLCSSAKAHAAYAHSSRQMSQTLILARLAFSPAHSPSHYINSFSCHRLFSFQTCVYM